MLFDQIREYPPLVDLFSGIPKDLLDECQFKVLTGNTVVYRQGEPVDKVIIICSGTMRVVNEFANGHSMIVTHVGFMNILGALEMLAEKDDAACSVITDKECKIIQLDRFSFFRWFNSDGNFARYIAKMHSLLLYPRTNELGEKIFYSSIYNVAAYLLKIAQDEIYTKQIVIIQKKRSEIAEELTISEKSVNRSLNVLKSNNLISIKKGKINIEKSQFHRLQEYAGLMLDSQPPDS